MFKRILITALGFAIATLVVPGIHLVPAVSWFHGWTPGSVLTLIAVAVIFGVVNAIIKPLFKALTGCFIMLTFGLLLIVINAFMMVLTAWICGQFNLGWGITDMWSFNGFVTALEGAIVVAIVSFIAAKVFRDKKD